MFKINNDLFQDIIDQVFDELKTDHKIDKVENLAIIYEDFPSLKQRIDLKLQDNVTLFGLYEGVPLPERQGQLVVIPSKITIFKGPMEQRANNLSELREMIKHTLWHELAHYYGLNHEAIYKLEKK
jgi:predicted Zn-dependent protease with MMP-like domain